MILGEIEQGSRYLDKSYLVSVKCLRAERMRKFAFLRRRLLLSLKYMLVGVNRRSGNDCSLMLTFHHREDV